MIFFDLQEINCTNSPIKGLTVLMGGWQVTKQIHIKAIRNNKTFYLGIYGKPKCHIYLTNLYYHLQTYFITLIIRVLLKITHIIGRKSRFISLFPHIIKFTAPILSPLNLVYQ